MSYQTIFYSHGQVDRATYFRKDEIWMAEKRRSANALIMPLWRTQNLLTHESDRPEIRLLSGSEGLFSSAGEVVFLGLTNQQPVFAIDLSQYNEEEALTLTGGGAFENIRKAYTFLSPEDAALLAYGRAIMTWHSTHQYCSQCGSKSESREGGHMRACLNPECGRQCFPRLDPAIITLIEYRPQNGDVPRCLLAGRNTPAGKICTTLAGFVEPGESLEEAVKREMMEEVGLEVENIRYVASQPWPFPASIMLGFRAESKTMDFVPDNEEIQEAHWYSAQELRELVNAGELKLSIGDSIARFLIESWMKDQ